MRCRGLVLALFAGYFDHTIGFSGANLQRLASIDLAIRCLGLPFVLAADFNDTPAALLATGWPSAVDATVLPPTNVDFTCSSGAGRLIDYMVISHSLLPLVRSCTADFNSTWAPHMGISLPLRTCPELVMVKSLRKPLKFEAAIAF